MSRSGLPVTVNALVAVKEPEAVPLLAPVSVTTASYAPACEKMVGTVNVRVNVPAPPAPATIAAVRNATEPVGIVAPVIRCVKVTVPVTVPPMAMSSPGVVAPPFVADTEIVMVSPGAAEAGVAETPDALMTGAAATEVAASTVRAVERK